MFFDSPFAIQTTHERHLPVKGLIDAAQEVATRRLEREIDLQWSAAQDRVVRLRRVHPDETPTQLLARLDREYISFVSALGVAAGAVVTSGGHQTGIPAALADVSMFTQEAVRYLLATADIHGLPPQDPEVKRCLVMVIVLGDAVTRGVNKAVRRIGRHWANQIVDAFPMSTINRVNSVLGPRFVTKYGTQGIIILGMQLAPCIGAALGGAGNYLIGRTIVTSARTVFGDAPAAWPDS